MPRVAFKRSQCLRLCTHSNPSCKSLARRLYLNDTSVFAVSFITLHLRPADGENVLCFLHVNVRIVCLCAHKRDRGIALEENSICMCQKKMWN